MTMSGHNKTNNPYEQFQNDPNTDYSGMNNYPTQTQTIPQVVVQPNAQLQAFTVESPSGNKWSWCHLVTAVFSLCCCQIFGIIATITAILSYVDHKTKDFERARNKRNVSYGFAIAGIVIGSLAIIGIIIAVSVLTESVASGIQTIQRNDDLNDNFNGNVNDFFANSNSNGF